MKHAQTVAAILALSTLAFAGAGQTSRAATDSAPPARIPADARKTPSAELPTRRIDFAVTLPLSNRAGLDRFVEEVNAPSSPQFGKYLTPQQFASLYGASKSDHDAIVKDLRSHGFAVTANSPTHSLILVSGTADKVEKTFGVHMNEYVTADGRHFHAPDAAPSLPSSLTISGANVVGLNSGLISTHPSINPDNTNSFGFNEDNGAGPSQIRLAYGLTSPTMTGSGQNIGLLELDDYAAADLTGYEQTFNLPATNVVRDQVQAVTMGAGQNQVTTDVEVSLALAPSATNIVVYEVPLSGGQSSFLAGLQAIANDTTHRCREISCSWTQGEDVATTSGDTFVDSENTIFAQMVAQGQAFFCASGNNGAFADGNGVTMASDPSAQPLVTSVGGTTITVGSDDAYTSETTWADTNFNIGSGGGISEIWPIPTYQQGIISHAPAGEFSTTNRNFPDVSLAADGNTGYAVYVQGGFEDLGGTGAASAAWCAFWASVNQQRAANSQPQLGFANPSLYRLGKSSTYARDFHDIADDSTNFKYHAVAGYDTATGWGTINSGLFNDLVVSQSGGTPNVLVAQNSTTHQIALYSCTNTGLTLTGDVSLIPTATQKVVGVGAFDGPGTVDLVLQDTSSGAISIWHMSGITVVATDTLLQNPGTAWSIVGVGDFNGDGNPDILFQNTNRALAAWLLKNYVYTGLGLPTVPTGNTVVGTGDFNDDGISDILIQNTTSRQLTVWHISGSTESSAVISSSVAAGWSVAAVVNVQGYANPDIIFQNGAGVVIWDMSDNTDVSGGFLTTTFPTGWKIVAPR